MANSVDPDQTAPMLVSELSNIPRMFVTHMSRLANALHMKFQFFSYASV